MYHNDEQRHMLTYLCSRLLWKAYNWASHTGSHYWAYHPYALSLNQVTAANLKIGVPYLSSIGACSLNDLRGMITWLSSSKTAPAMAGAWHAEFQQFHTCGSLWFSKTTRRCRTGSRSGQVFTSYVTPPGPRLNIKTVFPNMIFP